MSFFAMKRLLFLSAMLCSLNSSAHYESHKSTSFGHIISDSLHAALGYVLLTTAIYSAGQTLLDCGHHYYEAKIEYMRYLAALANLPYPTILTKQEKIFWGINQMISKMPDIFWREIISGTFSIITGMLAIKYLNKSLENFAKL